MKELKKSEECYISGGGVVFFRSIADGNVVDSPNRQDLLSGKVKLSTPTGGSNITTLAFKHSRY
ncbi:hypothetical protein [Neisseria musculi]|uniref:Uncharacterized protein n=1 Tax=Neisseria musculi TaxID=1815583 RepID=A0A7H1MDE8_9NEIS|nr:hypothetical protein [Neisseria musculi]QNT59663.1 hypothetical protein H7A79_1718 [Neisseria musculi]